MRNNLIRRIAASLIISVMLFALPIGAIIANSSSVVSVYADEEVPEGGTEETGEGTAGNVDNTDAAGGTGDAAASEGDNNGEAGGTGDDNSGSGDTSVSGNDSAAGEDPGNGEQPSTGEEPGNGDDHATDPADDPEPAPGEDPDPAPKEEPEPECICGRRCRQYDYNHNCPVCSTDYTKCEYKEPTVKITIDIPAGWYSAGTNVKASFKVEDLANTGNLAIKSVQAKIGQNGSYQDVTEDMCLDISENCTVYVLVTAANDIGYERSRAIKCFDTVKPTLNAAVSDGLLTVKASDNESGVKVIYVNGYEFTDLTNGTVNIRLSQFDAGYEYFTISAMDNAGNTSEVYKTKNPYYKDPNSNDNNNPADQLPKSAEPTKPANATATVTEHTKTDSNGNTTSQTPSAQGTKQIVNLDTEGVQEGAIPENEAQSENMNQGKEFYTIEAASGKQFFLIIDRDGQQEEVYFLTQITENDLLNVTTDNSETLPKNSAALESQIPVTESALPNNNTGYEETQEVPVPTEAPAEDTADEPEVDKEPDEAPSNPILGYILMAALGGIVIIIGYYFKVVKPRQDGDFIEEDEDEDEDTDAEGNRGSDDDEDDSDEYDDEEAVSEKDDFFSDDEKKEETPTLSVDGMEEDATETLEAPDDEDPYETENEE
ncbi:MAG: DUF4366 domain-containing protein [Lachnospiraceae bacterium]|nr:DUF4366 domain-containing protein [Lachnospiraceae bacterium]